MQYARQRDIVVVFPGAPGARTGGANLRRRADLLVWIDGAWATATGQAITAADEGFAEARSVYGRRWPRIRVDKQAVLARIHLDAAGTAGE